MAKAAMHVYPQNDKLSKSQGESTMDRPFIWGYTVVSKVSFAVLR